MLRSVKSLYGYSVQGIDGMIGEVYELYFTDDSWDVAHVVVRSGGLIHGRKILIPPSLLGKPATSSRTISAAVTTEQAMQFAGVESDMPVSSFKLMVRREYYDVPALAGSAGILPSPAFPPPMSPGEECEIEVMEKHRNPHLRRTREVARYHLTLKDGLRCPIDDIIMDDVSWRIVYFEASTGTRFNRRRVLIGSTSVSEIRCGENQVTAELSEGSSGEGKRRRRLPGMP